MLKNVENLMWKTKNSVENFSVNKPVFLRLADVFDYVVNSVFKGGVKLNFCADFPERVND